MRARRNSFLALLALVIFVFAGAAAAQTTEEAIDYDGFVALSGDLMEMREDRLISLETFNEMAADPGTIILDTRSAEAFAMGHIDGAVNLNFSDFTEEKLASVIGATGTRILIYCNNNFTDNAAPVTTKRAPLALNIPTFINLVGYGYDNVWELGALTETANPDVNWVVGAR